MYQRQLTADISDAVLISVAISLIAHHSNCI